MKVSLLILFLFAFSLRVSNAWGFFAHEHINTLAVFSLPPELFAFYKPHLNILAERAVSADKRRYILDSEAPKHYIDIDYYEGAMPLDTIRIRYDSAISIFGQDFLDDHGIAPWNIFRLKYALTVAFLEKNADKILRISADLGHYIGDIHVPLHANSNYNGQKTGQHGIHALWESRLPEMNWARYDLLTGTAVVWENMYDTVWGIVQESYELSEKVLKDDLLVKKQIPESKQYTYEMRNGNSFRNYSKNYRVKYAKLLGKMVESRLRSSVRHVAGIWLTAWEDAGCPDLTYQIVDTLSLDTASKRINRINNLKIKGRMEEH